MSAGIVLSDLLKKFPLRPLATDCIGFILNGGREECETEFAINRLAQKINQCSELILVDGGANHFLRLFNACQERRIPLTASPSYLIGDLDSVEESTAKILHSQFPSMQVERFYRDKPFTDLEAALQMAKLDEVAQGYLFYALGGRTDHELTVIKYMHTKQIRDKISIFHPTNGYLQVLSPTRPIELEDGETIQPFPLFSENALITEYANKRIVESGKMLCLVSQEGVPSDLATKLNGIVSLMQNPFPVTIATEKEEMFVVSTGQTVRFPAEIAQTISLIPIGGPAYNVKTEGLYWELDIEKFGRKICGVSNIATKKEVSLSVGSGSLLCIKNDFIDLDMYATVTNNS